MEYTTFEYMCMPVSQANIIIKWLNHNTNTVNEFPISEVNVNLMKQNNIPWFYTVYYNLDYNKTVFHIRDKSIAVQFKLMGFTNEKNN